ncbi:MAG: F0F1 ATP synthase subunit B [Parachlamydiaceae bacterium]|nr:F0F1 ATP synthase subunit B [Parachlamydiaceae bacterium]
MNIEIGQVFTQIISFLLMLWILSRYAWKPIMGTLDERKNKIEADFKSIEDEKKKIAEMRQEYQLKIEGFERSAQDKLQQVVEEAKMQSQKIHEEAHQNARALLVKAQVDIKKEIMQAHVQLKKDLVGLVLTSTEKVLEKNHDQETGKKLLEEIGNYVEAN